MKKIIIITFYFGKSPWYLSYFIQSCVSNKDVDFVFFTDIKQIDIKEENIKIIKISFEDFASTISSFFDFEINVKFPLKLCDIRPSFGEVFQDMIKGYEFWGYCDIDLIFGRIRDFLDENVLDNYDVIFSKDEYPSGFFGIYRNNSEINSLYRSSQDYIKVFQSEKLLLFDECGGHYDEVCAGVNILNTEYDIDSMHHILERNISKIRILYEFYSMEASPGKIRFDNGILSYNNTFEILLYHLTNFKVNFYFSEKRINKTALNKYYIDKYLIVKDSWKFIFFSNLYCLTKPFMKEKLMKIDCFLNSKIFKSRQLIKLKVGEYRYMKRIVFVEFKNECYYLVYPHGIRNEINFLKFSNNIFYEKKANLFYLMNEKEKDTYTSFNQIFKDGGVMKFKFIQ